MKVLQSILLIPSFFLIQLDSKAQEVENVVINQKHLDQLILSAIEFSSVLDQKAVEMKKYEVQKKMLNFEHLGLFGVAANLNEYSLRELAGDESVVSFFPRYNIGLSVNLNHFWNVKARKQLLAHDFETLVSSSEEIEKKIAEEVTKKYVNYLRQKNILNINKTLEQFTVADFNAMEKKFSEGEAELEQYNSSRRDFYNAKMQVIEAESQYVLAKTELEALVNSTLESLGIN